MRKQRIDFAGAVQHVMNRGVNRQRVFFGESDRVEFGDRLGEIHELFGVETLAYCLMDNHYHLLLRTPDGGLSDAMQRLGSVHTLRTNRRVGRDGPLFRGRFHSIVVSTDAYLLAAARYIHRNPLELRGVIDAESYRWSSYRTYLGLRPAPPFVRTDLVLALHGNDPARLAEYTVCPGMPPPTGGWTFADIDQLVSFEIARHDILHGDDDDTDRSRMLRRTLLVLLSTGEIDAALARAIDDRLAFPSPDARRMAVTRARRRARTDRTLTDVLGRLQRQLASRRRAA